MLPHVQQSYSPVGIRESDTYFTPAVDIYETSDSMIVLMDIPGIEQKDVDLDLKGNLLVVSAKIEESGIAGKPLIAEFNQGSFYRKLFVGEGIDKRSISATMRNGVLKIVFPKRKAGEPRIIPISL